MGLYAPHFSKLNLYVLYNVQCTMYIEHPAVKIWYDYCTVLASFLFPLEMLLSITNVGIYGPQEAVRIRAISYLSLPKSGRRLSEEGSSQQSPFFPIALVPMFLHSEHLISC